jgi:hypothetical protein
MTFQRNSKFKQGIYTPKNKHKYLGTIATYRSSYELTFMRWADLNDNVIKWGSENIIIPYISPIDQKPHKYFVDNFIEIKESTGIKKYLIEIKPAAHTVQPVPTKRKKKTTILTEATRWITNQAKWASATEYAQKRGWEFLILTEKHLNIK